MWLLLVISLSLSYLIVFNERVIVQIADKIPNEMVHCLNYTRLILIRYKMSIFISICRAHNSKILTTHTLQAIINTFNSIM